MRFLMLFGAGLCRAGETAAETPFTDVYKAGDANYSCYMNPSVITVDRTVLAFAEARWASCGDFDCRATPSGPVCGKHDIALRRSTDGGVTWSSLTMVVQVEKDFGAASSVNASTFNISPIWDSVRRKVVLLFNLQRGEYNTWSGLTNPKARETYVMVSADVGLSWSPPKNITSQLQRGAPWAATRNPMALTPGPGIQLSDGTLLVPGYGCPLPATATCVTYSLNSTMRMWAVRSTDGGNTWAMGNPAAAVGAAEPMAIQRPDGVLVMNARSVQWPHDDRPHPDRRRIYAISRDAGVTWQPPPPDAYTPLTGPSCEAAFVRAGGLTLFSNPANNIRRVNMTFRRSSDWGGTWESTVVYPNSSWYSSIAVVPPASARALSPPTEEVAASGTGLRREGALADNSTALLFFTKDCDSPIAPRTGKGETRDGETETDHCKSISLWKTIL